MSKRRVLKGEAPTIPPEYTITRSTRRQFFSTSFRLTLFLKRKGTCASCYLKIDAGKAWDIDHILPLALGGTNEPENLQILCKPCHQSKTSQSDIPRIAKTKRLKARHLGARSPSILDGKSAKKLTSNTDHFTRGTSVGRANVVVAADEQFSNFTGRLLPVRARNTEIDQWKAL